MVGADDRGRAGGDREAAEGAGVTRNGKLTMEPQFERTENLDRFFNALKALNAMDHGAIHNIVSGQMNPNQLERFMTLNYHRAEINVELLFTVNNTRQFQAIAMLARSIFELSVEINLMPLIENAGAKIQLFTEIEKLRSARQIVKFKAQHPDSEMQPTAYEAFVKANEKRIEDERDKLWNGKKVRHWSGYSHLAARAQKLGEPFEEMYQVNYSQLSWYVHSGVVGVSNVTSQLLVDFVGVCYIIAFHSYRKILDAVAEQFKLHKADPTLKAKMLYAQGVAFTDNEHQAEELRKACMNE
jgi:hypothetical protein